MCFNYLYFYSSYLHLFKSSSPSFLAKSTFVKYDSSHNFNRDLLKMHKDSQAHTLIKKCFDMNANFSYHKIV